MSYTKFTTQLLNIQHILNLSLWCIHILAITMITRSWHTHSFTIYANFGWPDVRLITSTKWGCQGLDFLALCMYTHTLWIDSEYAFTSCIVANTMNNVYKCDTSVLLKKLHILSANSSFYFRWHSTWTCGIHDWLIG